MKLKVLIFFLFIVLVNTFSLYSQITITDVEKSEEKIVLKPEPYDSLKNLEYKQRLVDYKQYIGLQIYLPPSSNPEMETYTGLDYHMYLTKEACIIPIATSKKLAYYDYGTLVRTYDSIMTCTYKPYHYYSGNGNYDAKAEITSDMNLIGNKYYTIVGVIYGDSLANYWKTLNRKLWDASKIKSNIYVDRIGFYGGDSKPNALFVIKDENDNIFYSRSITQFILVPYFVKQKLLFQNKYFLSTVSEWPEYELEDRRHSVKIEDNNGYEKTSIKKVKLKPHSKWLCTDVTLLKPDYQLTYILVNQDKEEITVNNRTLNDFFIDEETFIKKENEKKLLEAQIVEKRKQEEIKREEEEKKAFETRKIECVRLFGQQNGELIANGKVKIGMNQEMCKKAWGTPFWTDKVTTKYGISEVWYYGFGYSLHFENGILVVIDE